ncbi:hypothetical protein [Streptomyces sp. 7N604]|uniref:hypothetical protein n=1 Tax=Streptomyces sp. 7N604 TaxID=3457415 RepID=UPI003FD1CAFA
MTKRILTVSALAVSSTILAMGAASAAPASPASAPAPAAASHDTRATIPGMDQFCPFIQNIPMIGSMLCP